jgi:hypothetical protein
MREFTALSKSCCFLIIFVEIPPYVVAQEIVFINAYDLSLHIFHCSRIYGSVAGATSLVRRPLRHSLSHLKDSLQPFEQADGLVRGD